MINPIICFRVCLLVPNKLLKIIIYSINLTIVAQGKKKRKNNLLNNAVKKYKCQRTKNGMGDSS